MGNPGQPSRITLATHSLPCVGPRSVFLMVSWKSLISTDHTQLYSTTISGGIATCPLTWRVKSNLE